MEWYYKDKSDGSRHGVVDEDALFEMARKGALKPTDLVWSDKTGGRWVQASTVERLFPVRHEEKSKVAPAKAAAPPPAPERQREPTKKRSVSLVAVALVFIGMIGGLAVVYLRGTGDKLKLPPSQAVAGRASKPSASPVAPSQSQSNDEPAVVVVESSAIIEQFNTALANEDAAKASKLLVNLARSDEETGKVQELSKKLNVLRQTLARSKQLEVALRAGNMTVLMAAEIVTVFDGRKKRNELVNMMKAMLGGTNALSPDVYLGIARVCAVLKDHEQTKAALVSYTTRVTVKNNLTEYLEAAKMLQAENDPLRGADLMQRYLANDSTNSVAWFEYSAWKCAGGDSDAALEGLQKAVGYGGDDMKKKAQQDERFKPIMDTKKFRRLTKTDK